MQKDCTQCHHKSKPKRPTLTLKLRKPTDFLDIPELEIERKIEAYRTGQTSEQQAIRILSQELAQGREWRRRQAEARREVLEERRLVEERAKAVRVEREAWDREQKRKRWLKLLEHAVTLGLQPTQDWNESLVCKLIDARLAEQREVAQKVKRHRLRMRERQQIQRACQETFEDQFDHIPHIVKFGDFDRGEKARYDRGDLASWNQYWQYRRHALRKKVSRNPQKQPRTWELAAPRKWRRKDHCEQRWDHLCY